MRKVSLRTIGLLVIFGVMLVVSIISYISLSQANKQQSLRIEAKTRNETVETFNTFMQQEILRLTILAEQIATLSNIEHQSYEDIDTLMRDIWPRLELTSSLSGLGLFNEEGLQLKLGLSELHDSHLLIDPLMASQTPTQLMDCHIECELSVAIPLSLENALWAMTLSINMSEPLITFSQLRGMDIALLVDHSLRSQIEQEYFGFDLPVLTNSKLTGPLLSQLEQSHSIDSLFTQGVLLKRLGKSFLVWGHSLQQDELPDIKLLFINDITSTTADQKAIFRYISVFITLFSGGIVLLMVLISIRPLRRLAILAEAVNEIATKRYQKAQDILAYGKARFFSDEINRVHKALSNASTNLHHYEQELELSQQHLMKLATHDTTTGLLNRHAFAQDMEQLDNQKTEQLIALLFVDLDDFKLVNDNLGHTVGDDVLKEVGQRLTKLTNQQVIVCRIGGDEFVVRYRDYQRKEQVNLLADKILSAISEPMEIDEFPVKLSASIGIAYGQSQHGEVSELLRKADIAMYKAKSSDSQPIIVFDPSMEAESHLLFAIKSDFENSLSNNEFSVHYQPMLNFSDKKLVKMEALVRWRHATLGPIYPDYFIPILEGTGKIETLTDWIVDQVIAKIAELDKLGLNTVNISVNISGKQVGDLGYIQRLASKLAKAKINPRRIELEITETSLVDNFKWAKVWVELAQEAGFKIAMDDFGTGYSSLSYLTSIPFDSVKLDKSLINDIVTDSLEQKVVSAITGMLDSLQMNIVAEGIEDLSQFDILHDLGCDIAQGYLIAKPQSSEDLNTMLIKYQKGDNWFS